MNRSFISFIQLILVGLDIATINLIVVISYFLVASNKFSLFEPNYIHFWLALNIAWIIISWLNSIYKEKHITSFETFSRRSMSAFLYWVGCLILYFYFTRLVDLSRLFMSVNITAFGVMLLVNRFIYLIIQNYFRKQDYLIKKILIVGYNDIAKKLVTYLEDEGINSEFLGFCEDINKIDELSNYPILGSVNEVMRTSKANNVNEIYCTISPEQDEQIYTLMHEADQECIRFKLVPDLSYFINRPVHIDYFKDIPVLSLRSEPLDDVASRIKKRLFDLGFSFMVTVCILSWLIPLLGILIYIDSKGPIFFVQQRSGKNNQPFPCIKFRSMRFNADANLKQASRNDDRITSLGRFLRRSSLDEFPQFLNVLIGHMSIVGPRPHMLKHTEDYSRLLERYMIRQFLKPGITGWAQVNGHRGETRTILEMQNRVEHDIWYMENWSLWLDVRIIFITIYNTIRGDKNAF